MAAESPPDMPLLPESEHLSDESATIPRSEPESPHQAKDNMEVHHHAHHEGKKNWKSYFWEFLMLFLAVFCGFLAENFREHQVEKERELVYVESLVKDYAYDTLQFGNTIHKISNKIPYYDSVLVFLKNLEKFADVLPYRFYIKTNLEIIYTPLEPTLQQLKSSGNLRLLQKKLVLDSILIYDSKINGPVLNQNKYVVEFNKRLVQLTEKVFDNTNFNLFLNDVYNSKESADNAVYDVPLATKDKDKILEIYNLYINAKATDVFYMSMLKTRKTEAERLIALIRKEYEMH